MRPTSNLPQTNRLQAPRPSARQWSAPWPFQPRDASLVLFPLIRSAAPTLPRAPHRPPCRKAPQLHPPILSRQQPCPLPNWRLRRKPRSSIPAARPLSCTSARDCREARSNPRLLLKHAAKPVDYILRGLFASIKFAAPQHSNAERKNLNRMRFDNPGCAGGAVKSLVTSGRVALPPWLHAP